MKRHESIMALSRDHHFGLLFCWKVRQGIKKQVPARRIQSYIKYFWENHLQFHFKEEETVLFAVLHDSVVEHAISEHKHIQQLMRTIIEAAPVQSSWFGPLADALDNHIRFEERILFPYIEKEVPEEKLVELGKQLQQMHPLNEKDTYSDEFWM